MGGGRWAAMGKQQVGDSAKEAKEAVATTLTTGRPRPKLSRSFWKPTFLVQSNRDD